ncbi:Tdh, Threonine dehydrogenase and related Zn-dependent dehydrogenase [Pyrenophora tritici-repentis]|uniref:Tdh, Threonine dehydrogenase and related Zn-dependent dehydrogenase n=2 Tax=Pyrenophora tritici-repentis TaxID=45151 RepID=A0A834VP24_9PLEO|nr:sorbitol dehydrogenase [Pyrenophora tritici-repentis Pt-1C-BFP]EDU49019.1 sorbitol dehydrogenase [Pyrenophora tritici-repentis Pt-1C-BFP]KAF7570173.1 Tdh, Threonine dehydrogenase and related Zn-dependent dehydrogenase [Pyrenophora tritici-repentis]
MASQQSEQGGRQIRASVLHGARDLRIESRSILPPSPTELQISIRSTGLCGSDLHYYRHYRNGDIIVREPMSLGHESAGVVVGVGSEVSNFKVGDKVALEGMKFRSSAKAFPHAQGTLQDRINHPAAWCHKLPEDVSLDLGALLEPLSVAIQASKRAQLAPGSTVLVFGAGAVGLLVAAMAKISGAGTVVIADIDAGRVEFAVENRFAHRSFTVPMKRGNTIEEQLEIAKELAADIGKLTKMSEGEVGEMDAVFECTGVPSCVQASIFATRPGGKVLLIGMGTPIQTLPISAAALREVDIVGVFRYANTYPMGIEVVSKKGDDYPNFAKLVTHTYKGLESAEEAFEMAGKTKDESGKLVIKVVLETGEDEK